MMNSITLSPSALDSIKELEEHLAGISAEQLVETALAITSALYQKSSEGARINIEYPDGKSEELRFRVKRPARKKNELLPD